MDSNGATSTGPTTLYIKNIEEKINKNVLKQLLYMMFSQYGRIVDVVACKGTRLRGQAWVAFKDHNAATNALRSKQGFSFYGKELSIAFSTNSSRVESDRERVGKIGGGSSKNIDSGNSSISNSNSSSKRQRESNSDDRNDNSSESSRKRIDFEKVYASLMPSKTLCALNLPASATREILLLLFQNSSGLQGIRMSERPGIAQVDFSDETHASMALKQLQGFRVTATDVLQLSYSNPDPKL